MHIFPLLFSLDIYDMQIDLSATIMEHDAQNNSMTTVDDHFSHGSKMQPQSGCLLAF